MRTKQRNYSWEEIKEIRLGEVKKLSSYTVIYFCAREITREDLESETMTITPGKDIIMMKYRKAVMERIEKYSGKKVIWMVDKIRYF